MGTAITTAIDAVMKALESAQYAPLTLLEYEKTFQRFESFAADLKENEYTHELGAKFAAFTESTRTGAESEYRRKKQGRCIRLINSYIATGEVDLTIQKWQNRPEPRTADYRSVLESFLMTLSERGLSQSTINSCRNLACGYLIHLESLKLYSLEKVPPSTIGSYLSVLLTRWQPTTMRSAMASFRPFIYYLEKNDLIYAVEEVRTLRSRKIVSSLSKVEQAALCDLIAEDYLSARDRSIICLGLLTGIRACDILALTLDDIDWNNDCLSIVQQKTGNPLNLPLLPVVGNAIYDYIVNERPNTTIQNVFLRSVAPYEALSDHASIYIIIKKGLLRAGIEHGSRVCGSRLLRCSAATNMLAAGVRAPTISAVLGHADPTSTDAYLCTDETMMRECVLALKVGLP